MIAGSVTGRWGVSADAEQDSPVIFELPKTSVSISAYRIEEYSSILILNYRTDPGLTQD